MITSRAIDLLAIGTVLALLLHMGHMPWWLSAPLALAILLRWWQMRRGGKHVSAWLKLPLILLLLSAVIMAYGTIFGRAPGSALAVGLLVLKMMEIRRPRDIRSSVAFGCFVLMSALLFGQSMSFTVLVMLGLIPNLAALRAIQPRGNTPGWRAELQPVALSVLLALPVALFAFMFVPRLTSPLWGAAQAGVASTGLNDEMTPGNLTELLIDDSPAMRVNFKGAPPPPQQRYFRAWVMTHFDGHTWRRPRRWYQRPRLQAERSITYTIQLEPSSSHVLPALGIPMQAPPRTHLSSTYSIVSITPFRNTASYTIQSAMRYRLEPRLDAASRMRNLTLPEGFNPRARQLAADWSRQHGGDGARIAATAMAWYRQNGFQYNLSPAPLGHNSIDDFLFSTREGFCEHYASSFTFLMRAAGIPARVVTGYHGGWWNEIGGYLLVRKSSAHAWSEIWLPQRGWVRYDPTASVQSEQNLNGQILSANSASAWYQAAWIRNIRNQWDTINHAWSSAVVAFNRQRQKGLLTPFGVEETDVGKLTMILAIGCSLLLALATWWSMRSPPRQDPLQAIQRQLERHLARHGVVRDPTEPPRAFMHRAMRMLPDKADWLQRVYTNYMHLRYARQEPETRELHAYRRLVRESIKNDVVKP